MVKEEKELLHSFNQGEWERVSNHKEELEKYQKVAENALKKDKRINIRISGRDLTEIRSF